VKEIRSFPERCTGCRVCELVCSFHFTGAFGRKAGAIEVRRDEPTAEFVPIIHKKAAKLWKACDLCSGEKTYLCAKYCVVKAIEVITR
jgi:Fe-S-cluster-containing hydrogenase component 2